MATTTTNRKPYSGNVNLIYFNLFLLSVLQLDDQRHNWKVTYCKSYITPLFLINYPTNPLISPIHFRSYQSEVDVRQYLCISKQTCEFVSLTYFYTAKHELCWLFLQVLFSGVFDCLSLTSQCFGTCRPSYRISQALHIPLFVKSPSLNSRPSPFPPEGPRLFNGACVDMLLLFCFSKSVTLYM